MFDLKIFENWKNQIENQFVNENSHDFSSDLTNFEFSNFARAEWRDFDDDQKATAQQNSEIVLWFVSQFLIFSQKKRNRKISILKMRFWKWIESSFVTSIFFFCWRFFWAIRWLYDDFFREFIFRLWSDFFDRNVSKFDCFSNFCWFDANNDFFAKSDQFCNAVRKNYHSNIDESYFAHCVFFLMM